MIGADDITQRALARCRALGFALAGVCDAQPSDFEPEVRAWLKGNQHGEMDYLAKHAELRFDPENMLPGAKSIICVADRYAGHSSFSSEDTSTEPREGIGRVARYARGDDYHKTMRKRLTTLARELGAMFPHELFRACVDTAPLFEREHAQRAGLGAIGKNTMLIEPGVGSWILLGEIVTTLQLAPSHSPVPTSPPPSHTPDATLASSRSSSSQSSADPCGSCTRCIDACPTRAIAPEGHVLDGTRCISYLTIEHRSLIDESFHDAMGDWIFGCDICQEVCPHNQPTARTLAAPVHEAYRSRLPEHAGFDLLEVLNWDEDARRAAMINSSMKRARLDMMKRNALIAAGNALRKGVDAPALRLRIEELATSGDEPTIVRETAQVVLRECSCLLAFSAGESAPA